MNHSNYHGRPPTKNTRKPGQSICSHVLRKVNELASLSFCIPEVYFFTRLPVWVPLNALRRVGSLENSLTTKLKHYLESLGSSE